MPNWVINKVRAANKADTEKLIALLTKKTDGDATVTNFNGVIPMPQELRDTPAAYGDDNDDRRSANLAKYGYHDWYDFAVSVWGTKWDGVECNIDDGVIEFQTAWSIPDGVYREIAKTVPIIVAYADEDIGFNFGVFKLDADGEDRIVIDGTDNQVASAIWGHYDFDPDEEPDGQEAYNGVLASVDEILYS